jgi:hypothetical protein
MTYPPALIATGTVKGERACHGPTGVILGLGEQLDVPALNLQKLTSLERKQLAGDQIHYQQHLKTIETKLASDPKPIQESLRVITHRLEPVRLVYHWPI